MTISGNVFGKVIINGQVYSDAYLDQEFVQ